MKTTSFLKIEAVESQTLSQIAAMRASKSAAALILGGSKPELLGASAPVADQRKTC